MCETMEIDFVGLHGVCVCVCVLCVCVRACALCACMCVHACVCGLVHMGAHFFFSASAFLFL